MNKNDELLMDGIDERIESFLRGEMSTEEETAFKMEVKSNPELHNRAMAMTTLIRGLHAKNITREENVIRENVSKSRVRPVLWWACSVAAVFAIFFSIYKNHRYRTLDAFVSPYYTEYNMSDISRGDVDSAKITHLYTLFNNIIEQRNVTNIIKELEPIYETQDTDFTYNAYANDIAWNLALAYIKDDQIDKAIPILERLKADNPDTPIYNKADELMKKLSDL